MWNAEKVLKKLELPPDGHYDNHFYVVDIEGGSDAYLDMYNKLRRVSVNTEYPSLGTNTNDTLVKVTNYFETDVDGTTYNIFLIADFNEDKYYIRIGEK